MATTNTRTEDGIRRMSLMADVSGESNPAQGSERERRASCSWFGLFHCTHPPPPGAFFFLTPALFFKCAHVAGVRRLAAARPGCLRGGGRGYEGRGLRQELGLCHVSGPSVAPPQIIMMIMMRIMMIMVIMVIMMNNHDHHDSSRIFHDSLILAIMIIMIILIPS
jgi:hypothetical protein